MSYDMYHWGTFDFPDQEMFKVGFKLNDQPFESIEHAEWFLKGPYGARLNPDGDDYVEIIDAETRLPIKKFKVMGGMMVVKKYYDINDWTNVKDALVRELHHRGSPDGDYLEFGTYVGCSMVAMMQVFETVGFQGRGWGFDSFEGLPSDGAPEGFPYWRKGMYTCPQEIAVKYLTQHGIDSARYTLVKGWYKDLTLERWNTLGIGRLAVVLMDCDLPSSAIDAFKFVGPHLTTDTLVITDEWEERVLTEHPLPHGMTLKLIWNENDTCNERNTRMFEVEVT